MNKKSYWLALALLLAALALAACGSSGSATGSGDVTNPSSTTDTTGGAANGSSGADTQGGDVVTEGVNGSNELSGPGDASGGNAGNDAGSATDVGSGSDGAQGSGGSNQAGGSQAPNQPNGAVTQGDATGNSATGTGDTDSSQGTAAGTQAATGAAGGYTPIDDAACTEVQDQLTRALGVDVSRSTAPAAFQDLSGGTGQSCQLTIAATGAQFPNMVDAGQRIAGALTPNGWTLDPQYAADSPTGTIHGLRRDNQLAVYNVQWAPAAGITCPADQPIATCAESLTPDQMVYTITVDLAQQ